MPDDTDNSPRRLPIHPLTRFHIDRQRFLRAWESALSFLPSEEIIGTVNAVRSMAGSLRNPTREQIDDMLREEWSVDPRDMADEYFQLALRCLASRSNEEIIEILYGLIDELRGLPI